MFESKVEFRKVKQPSCLPLIEIVRLVKVGQTFVIGEDLDCGRGAQKIVSPRIEGSHDSE